MSTFYFNLLLVVFVMAALCMDPSGGAKVKEDGGTSVGGGTWGSGNGVDNNPSTEPSSEAEGQVGGGNSNCKRKVVAELCRTNGYKCGKSSDCCRNLYCAQTKHGRMCRPGGEE